MPVTARRQQIFAATQMTSSDRFGVPSYDAVSEHIWVVDDFKKPQKEMDSPSAPLGKEPSRKHSVNNLRISTYPKPELHERYMSSEEEPSPSPDSETGSANGGDAKEEEQQGEGQDQELRPTSDTTAEREKDEAAEALIEEYKAEIAIAVPIMAIGRPKLVDITSLAPMHKRKRSSADKNMLSRTAAKTATAQISSAADENNPFGSQDSAKWATTEEHLPSRRDSVTVLAPESWLPEDDSPTVEEKDMFIPELELHRPPSYSDYDPYSLNAPRLSPRNSPGNALKKPGSVGRARKRTNAPFLIQNNPGLKGVAKSLNMAKRQEAYLPTKQVAKKPKMLARGPTERTEMPVIPPFPFEDHRATA